MTTQKSVVMAISLFDKDENTLAERVSRFSDWHRARRAVALSMKYIKRLKRRTKGEPDETFQVSAEDLEEAGRAIIRSAQLNFFQEDIKVLAKETRRQKSLTKAHSSISKLDPFIDEDGILRVGGQLKHADIPDQVKYLVILPKNSHVTNLIVKCYHEKVSHQGKGMTLKKSGPVDFG